MDSPFERPQNPSPPPSSPSTPVDGTEFLFPSASNGLTRQNSEMSSDGYETDSQLGDDVPLSLTAASSMESLPTEELSSPFILGPVPNRFFGAYHGKHATLSPNLGRYLMTNRRFNMDDEDDDGSKRMRRDEESDDEELPTDEKTFIDNPMEDKKEKSDDDDLYEF